MKRKIKIGWDISHQEFTIEDHYYYSYLKTEIKKSGAYVDEVIEFKNILDYDVAVLNYPEKPFNKKEIIIFNKFMSRGSRAVITGYYNNEDRIADCINSLSSNFGLEIRKDQIKDKESCLNKDELLVITGKIDAYNSGVEQVMFPCCASIKLLNNNPRPFVRVQNEGNKGNKLIGAETQVEDGRLILIGTCVFWDNYAISKFSNLRFSLNLLLN